MTILEIIMIMAALALNVFLMAEYEGCNLKILNIWGTSLIILIFFIGQSVSFALGYLITMIPFFKKNMTGDVRSLLYVLSAIILLLLGACMVYRTGRHEKLEERLRKVSYKRLILEAASVALFTFLAGIATGFLSLKLSTAFIAIVFTTIAAVLLGLYAGYSQGYRLRRACFGISSALFLFTGVEILFRYL